MALRYTQALAMRSFRLGSVALATTRTRDPRLHHSGRFHTTARAFAADPVAPPTGLFKKILIANRGEIACRVMKTCKRLGIKTVAVYSEADAQSLHVRLADEAVCIGPPAVAQSYLVMDKIIKAVRDTGAEAVHPGYGFLSENVHFAERLAAENVAFIGPNVKAIGAMGDKIESKLLAKAAKVNVIPGFDGIVESAERAVELAEEIGYPVMLKASAGGGGKGMRFAFTRDEVLEGFKLSQHEAASSFGDDRILIEKYIAKPRHIEVQVMGDKHGNCVYLNERECSIQRRNQKVIEEAPSSFLDAETRAAMGAQAVMLARAVDYDSAGTVEFLVDHERNFYFLEMNTRLQVEHPITECITGVDLVELMIHSAANEPLPIKQSDIGIKGWAMEARVYAEDSELFLPSIGRLTSYQEPPSGVRDPFVRCDTGIVEGSEISMFYDPMICKLIASSDHDDPSTARDEARERLCAALDAYVIQGVTHNIPLLRDILTNEAFARGDLSTNFLPEEYPHGFKGRQLDDEGEAELIAGATAMRLQQIMTAISFSDNQRVPEDYHVRTVSADSDEEVMSAMDNKVMFENSAEEIASLPARLVVDIKGGDGRTRSHAVAVESLTGDEVNLRVAQLDGGDDSDAQGYQTKSMTVSLPRLRHAALLEFDVGAERPLLIEKVGENGVATVLRHQGSLFEVSVLTQQESRLLNALPVRVAPDTSHEVVSPMPGTVVSVASLQPGDVVVKGQEVAVIEAMKMQNSLRAARSGVVKRVYAAQGDTLAADQLIIEFEKE